MPRAKPSLSDAGGFLVPPLRLPQTATREDLYTLTRLSGLPDRSPAGRHLVKQVLAALALYPGLDAERSPRPASHRAALEILDARLGALRSTLDDGLHSELRDELLAAGADITALRDHIDVSRRAVTIVDRHYEGQESRPLPEGLQRDQVGSLCRPDGVNPLVN